MMDRLRKISCALMMMGAACWFCLLGWCIGALAWGVVGEGDVVAAETESIEPTATSTATPTPTPAETSTPPAPTVSTSTPRPTATSTPVP